MSNIQKVEEDIAELLKEPDIQCMNWELGKSILASWRTNLPTQILNLTYNGFSIRQLIEMGIKVKPDECLGVVDNSRKVTLMVYREEK